MMRMSRLVGVFLTITVGIVATVLAQAPAAGTRPTPSINAPGDALNQPPPTAIDRSAVYECEIRIFKDGAPVTAIMKVTAVPGQTSHFTIPDGTFDVHFKTASEVGQKPETPRVHAATLAEVLASQIDMRTSICATSLLIKSESVPSRIYASIKRLVPPRLPTWPPKPLRTRLLNWENACI